MKMNIEIVPIHHKVSKNVEKWSDVAEISSALQLFLTAGNFKGVWKEGYALSHCQIESDNPLRFFVVNEKYKKMFGGYTVICNAKIIWSDNMIHFREACLSFPFSKETPTRRWDKIQVEFEVPRLLKFLGNGLKTKSLFFESIPAFVFQHEIDHQEGKNIYNA